VNIPWAVGGAGDADYIYAFQKIVMPIAYEFNPQLVIGMIISYSADSVSAGFDAAAGDPIGGCEVTPAGYAHMTHMLMPLAEGKLVLALEVNYWKLLLRSGWIQSGVNIKISSGMRKSVDGRTAWSTRSMEIICQRIDRASRQQSHSHAIEILEMLSS
jgi:acetoin utilization deacetylase AcuC-like enzyme